MALVLSNPAAHLCFIKIITIMKKILFWTVFSLGTLLFVSCTADDITDAAVNQVADDTGGQNGTPPPPPPPPDKTPKL